MAKRCEFEHGKVWTGDIAGTMLIRDPNPIVKNFKRVYTVIAVNNGTRAPTKIRFGIEHGDTVNYYEEEPSPAINTYYTTRREYHTRLGCKGIVALHDCQVGDLIRVNWHGYDIPIQESEEQS